MAIAAQRWADQLAAWAIPQEILDAAPESPWYFPPELFGAWRPGEDTLSRRVAREAIPDGGTVLDIGTGGGAAGLPLSPPATLVTGVDEGEDMLATFAARADEMGVPHAEVQGSWPDVADAAPVADVVVCHHVLYNVPDLPPFIEALTNHARQRVVVEVSERHPLTAQASLWKHFWDLDRPDGPTAEEAIAVMREMGLQVASERSQHDSHAHEVHRAQRVAFTRRRLCLTADRDPEVDAILPELGHREVMTIWWPGAA